MPMSAKEREMAMKAIMVKKARAESQQLKGAKAKEANDYAVQKRKEAEGRKMGKQARADAGLLPGNKVSLYAAAVKKQNEITQRQTMKRVNRHPNPNPGLKLAMAKQNTDRPLSARSDDSVEARYGNGRINRDRKNNPDEVWHLYNKMQKEEFDSQQEELKMKKKHQQATQKAAINRQKSEQKRIMSEEQQRNEAYNQQQIELRKRWQDDEKKQRLREQEKNQQFTRSFGADIKRLENQKKEEAQRKLALENRTMMKIKKEQEDERKKAVENKAGRMMQMEKIRMENNALLMDKEKQRVEAVASEQRLNAEYRAKLEKQDRDREEGLKKTYAHQEKLMDLGKFAQQSMADRLKADEDRAHRVQMERMALEEKTAREKELAAKKRARDQVNMLNQQVRTMKEEREREIQADRKSAADALMQSRKMDEAEKKKQDRRKQDCLQQQQQVKDQISIRRQKKEMGQLNDNRGLSAAEIAMNKAMIEKMNKKYGDQKSVLSMTGSSIAKV